MKRVIIDNTLNIDQLTFILTELFDCHLPLHFLTYIINEIFYN